MEVIETRTLGDGWLEVSRRIVAGGDRASYDGDETRELALVTLAVAEPDPDDETIARAADREWLDWMHRNFTELDDVPSSAARGRTHAASARTRGATRSRG
jgi:hypothetical protein